MCRARRSERVVARDQRDAEVVVGCIERRDDVAEASVLARMARQVVTKLDETLTPVDVRIVDPRDPSPPPAGDLVEVGEVVGPDGNEFRNLPCREQRQQQERWLRFIAAKRMPSRPTKT